MSMRDDLQDIHGIGEAKADEIMAVVDAHDTGGVDRDLVEEGYAYLVEEERPGYAEKFFRRALGYEN